MIQPHNSEKLLPLYIFDDTDRENLSKEAQSLPFVTVSSAAAANAVMLGSGYFTPLKGYMNLEDSISVAENMHTKDGLFWPIPIVNVLKDVSAIKDAKKIALRDPNVNGNPVIAVQDVNKIEQADNTQLEKMAQYIFGTLDKEHPGVSTFLSAGNYFVSGPIKVLNFSYFKTDFPNTFKTAYEIREIIEKNNWNTVVAFQTRNPMHRAHEELVRMAMDTVNADGAIIHMLLGKLKKGDIPADVRDKAIRKMVEIYFEPNTVEITGYGFDMLYAGPKEAVLHAVFRQNMGASHLIVGRDHAGVGSYYGPFDAQKIFKEKVPSNALKIKVFEADHTAFSKKLKKVVMMKDAPDHTTNDFVLLSGTKVREMLSNGQELPEEFARPEIAKILMDYYLSTKY